MTTRQQNTVPTAVQRYFDAVLAGSADALAQCFVLNGVVIDVDRRIVGRRAIRDWAEREVIGGRYSIIEVEPRRDGVSVLLMFAPPGPDSEPFRARYQLDLEGDRILNAELQYA